MKNYRDRLVFYIKTSSCEEISSAGESYLATLYKAPRSIVTLNKLRYHAFNILVARQNVSAAFDMAALPPSSSADKQHSYRIFHHIQQWLGVQANNWANWVQANILQANNWGWKLSSNNLKPVTSEDSPALKFLMKLVFCSYQYQGGCSASSRRLLS